MTNIRIEDLDPSGDVRQAADDAGAWDPSGTRRNLLRQAGIGGAAVFGVGALLSPLDAFASASASQKGAYSTSGSKSIRRGKPTANDVKIGNYALTLEYLEAAFYNGATAAKLTLTPQVDAFLKTVTADENAHVKFLKKALGSKAAREPKFNFAGANTSPEAFMKTAQVLENTGVHAYLGQVLNIKNPAYVVAAGSILTIEARHASVIGLLNEASPAGAMIAPDGPFDKPWTAGKVLKEVEATKFIAG